MRQLTLVDLEKLADTELLLPSEVAHLWRVDTKTVSKWAALHRIESIQTPGGHYRIFAHAVKRHLLLATAGVVHVDVTGT